MPRPVPAVLTLLALLIAVPAAQAQLGGLVKKKAVEKVTGKKDTVAAAGGGAKKEKCDMSSLVITSDVVSRYLRSLDAANAMPAKLAKEPGPVGAYYSAVLKRKALQERKDMYDLRRGPDYERMKALEKRFQNGDTTAIMPYATFASTIDPNSVTLPQLEWDDQQKVSAKTDSSMKAAGNFNDCDWLQIGERLPRVVYTMASDEKVKDYQGYATAKEVEAIKPRYTELARGLGIKVVSPEDKARLKREDDSARTAAQALPSSGNAQTDCVMKAQRDYSEKHKAEMDKATQAQDMNAMMKFSMEMNAYANEQCNKE